jgi:type I restriction enzyme R subunit
MLREMMTLRLTEANINEFGRLDKLKSSIDKEKAYAFFSKQQGEAIKQLQVSFMLDRFLRKFLLEGGFDLEDEPYKGF